MKLDHRKSSSRSVCPLCRTAPGKRLESLRFQVFDSCPLQPEMDLMACGRCGFGYYDTPSTQRDFDDYYRRNAYYGSARTSGAGGGSPDDARFVEQLERFVSHIAGRDTRIVDVGCGQAGLLARLKRTGFSNLVGIDLLAESIAHTTAAIGIEAIVGSATDLPIEDRSVGALVLSHVLEHIIDPHQAVKEASRVLEDDGLVYVEVPDATRYGEAFDLPYQELYLEHVNHFGIGQLDWLFGQHGFSCLASGRCTMPIENQNGVPCIYAALRKNRAAPRPCTMPVAGSELQDYVDRSNGHSLLRGLERLARSRRAVSVWGASQHAMLLLGQTALGECCLRWLVDVDSYKQSQTIAGHKIESPEVLRGGSRDDIVLVTADRYREQIVEQLKSLGYRGCVVTLSELADNDFPIAQVA
ncbi:MAG TPA: class I SAM-dependent methyltransferase [Pirellulaceae bacterium]|nr:class I SAM-dependent methyltransferase [Pirellulaceae bacterium]